MNGKAFHPQKVAVCINKILLGRDKPMFSHSISICALFLSFCYLLNQMGDSTVLKFCQEKHLFFPRSHHTSLNNSVCARYCSVCFTHINSFNPHKTQWFSTQGDFPHPHSPRRHMAISGDIFYCCNWRVVTGIQQAAGRNTAQHPTMSRSAPLQHGVIQSRCQQS